LVASAGLAFTITLGAVPQSPFKWEVTRTVQPASVRLPLSVDVARTYHAVLIYRLQQIVSEVFEDAVKPREYPRSIVIASGVVLFTTFIGAMVGYFSPGPITGAVLPVAVTLWWGLYRVILRHDQQGTIGRQ
jgi:hypothetical protein